MNMALRSPARLWLACCGISSGLLGQSTLNVSQDLVKLGIDSTNMNPNQRDLDSGPLFRKAVNYAQGHQIPLVIADPGAYYFHTLQTSNAHVSWNFLTNLTIDLRGSDLYFTNPLQNGIFIANC